MRCIDVGLEERGYSVRVGSGILPRLGRHCKELDLGSRVAVISDEAVAECYLRPVVSSLEETGYKVLDVVFSGGETAKSLEAADSQVFAPMIAAELDRGAWVLALGGGVVGDLAGFVAATFLRGIEYVQVPTTIVAQVDASIGGKTAVNHRLGKNLIGAFHQPRLVYIDTQVLKTLPQREVVAGLAEVVKHGMIRDEELFAFMEEHLDEALAMELRPEMLDWLIARNVEIKVGVVEADEKEGGLRAILNYGHTIGQAIEAATGYKRYRHGEAVILGMIGAGEIALRKGLWPGAERRRQDALLERMGVPGGLAGVSTDRILARTRADKKRLDGRSRFVLARRIGKVEIVDGVEEEVVRAGVEYVKRNYG